MKNKLDKWDNMSMFSSPPRGFGKILQRGEKIRNTPEWDEQLAFAKWLKHEHPEIFFRSDEQNAKKRTGYMQNIMDILDPYRKGWPDTTIYKRVGQYVGLMIEQKHPKSARTGEHIEEQKARHEQLREEGWFVTFSWSADESKEIFLKYIEGKFFLI